MIGIATALHPAQREVYVDQLINANSPHYNIGGYIKLTGILDKEKYLKAAGSAPEVFDAYRMRFDPEEADLKYFTDDDFDILEITGLDFSNREDPFQEAVSWMQFRFNTPFIISKDSLLFEHALIRISDEEHLFYGRYHHLITDGYGFINFIQYVGRKYKSLLTGEEVRFEYPSYLEETEKAAEYIESAKYITDKKYWEDKIPERIESLLQKKYFRSDHTGNKSTTLTLDISEEHRELFEKLRLKTGSGIQQLTIAALLIYFGRITDRSEFIFGIPVHKRGSKLLRSTVGMFSGVLPFKGTFRRDIILSELLKDITRIQKSDYRHQHFPVSEIGRNTNSSSYDNSLYDISINYEPLNFDLGFGKDLKADLTRLEIENEKDPLQIFWRDYGNNKPLQLVIKSNAEYFIKEETQLLAERMLYIIEQFPGSLEVEIGNIDLIPAKEREMLREFNDTSVDFRDDENIVQMFEKQASNNPDRIALEFEDHKLTYKELNERANKLAHFLRSKGVKEETMVPICVERGFAMIEGILGILKAGGAYVPVDPNYPEERIEYMLKDTGAKNILCSNHTHMNMPSSKDLNLICLDHDDIRMEINKHLSDDLNEIQSPDQLAYVIYTSGSTGKPKGVMIEHGAVANLVNSQSAYFRIDPTERILQFSNYSFDASVEQIFLALCNGASLILFPEGSQLNAEQLEILLDQKQISHLHATPSFLEGLDLSRCKHLNRIIAGGDVCKKELAIRMTDTADFYNEYGPTETTVTSTEFEYKESDENNHSLPIGKPLANIQIYILNKQDEECPIGVTGEICIAGECLARGYMNLPELTAEKFVKKPFSKVTDSLMYRTGDNGIWLADGNLEFQGRIDEQLKIRGYRIEPGEIENAIRESGYVNDSVIIAKPDADGNRQLVGYVLLKDKFNREALQSYLKKKLPEYMIPALWKEMETFPMTSNGKIDRIAFPDPDINELVSSEYEAPETEFEITLTGLWKELFKSDKIGVNDNFFELGGSSLMAIRLITLLHKKLNLKTDAGTIFSNPTVKELSKAIERTSHQHFSKIVRLPESDHYELSHSQKRFWILSKFKDGAEAYNVSNVFSIEGKLNVKAFKLAFDAVIERHEILRTVFMEIEGEPGQKILSLKESGFRIEEKDLNKESDADKQIRQYSEEDARLPFDLQKGPLIRAVLFKENDYKYILVLKIHHIISDGWSKEIFLKNFQQLYEFYSGEEKSKTAPLSIQYKDYAAWHNDSFKTQGQYWRNTYKSGIPGLKFPLDFERPEVLTYFGETINTTLPESLTSDLQSTASKNNLSLNNLLIALYALAVAGTSGQDEVVVGTVSSGRSHPDLEDLIGVFVNFLPVRLLPNTNLKLSEYLNNCQRTLSACFTNQDYPFDLMVEDNIKTRDISRNPFFDTMINFQPEADEIKLDVGQGKITIKPYFEKKEDLFQSVLDFKLDVVPDNGKLNLYLSYNTKLFKKETMDRFLNSYTELLEKIAVEPDGFLTEYGKGKSDSPGTETKLLPVVLCASFVIDPVKDYIEYWSKEYELDTDVIVAPYNQVFQQLLNPASFFNCSSGINILFIRFEDWLRDNKEPATSEQEVYLNKIYDDLVQAIQAFLKDSQIPTITGIIPVLSESNYGSKINKIIGRLNIDLKSFLMKYSSVQILDLNEVAALYEIEVIYDPIADEAGHMPFTPEYYAALGTFLARRIRAYREPAYKVIALDCDNTLWKGVCGEDGAEGIIIDENFIKLQEFMIKKYNEGYLLVLCSKNNEEDVREVFEKRTEMKLKREHIAAHRINWKQKSENLLSIAKELNLGTGSFIFIDDSEIETDQMNSQMPEVLSLTLPEDPESFRNFLDHIWAFDKFNLTDEDRSRNEMYQTEKRRTDERSSFSSLDEYLKSLNLKTEIMQLENSDIERAVQLITRTNQFNLNGIRRSQKEILEFMNNEDSISIIVDVSDRFGDYGKVGLVLGKKVHKTLLIDSFLLSCRVLGRNVEQVIFRYLRDYCKEQGLEIITLNFIDTTKNKPFQDFSQTIACVIDVEAGTYCYSIKSSDRV